MYCWQIRMWKEYVVKSCSWSFDSFFWKNFARWKGSEWSGSGEDCHVSGTRFVSVAYRERKCGIWYEISRSIERKTSGKIGLLFENGTPSRVRGLSSP